MAVEGIEPPSDSWHEVAARHPEFVQWIVAKFGPLPDGPVTQEDYDRYADAYREGRV